jgi:hypothetical protein
MFILNDSISRVRVKRIRSALEWRVEFLLNVMNDYEKSRDMSENPNISISRIK